MSSVRTWMRAASLKVMPTTTSQLQVALSYLTPWSGGPNLVRVGGESDGGYLVPDDFSGVSTLLSPGVAATWEFERALGDDFGIRSEMVDGSVDAPPGLTDLQRFQRKWLATTNGPDRLTLGAWVRQSRVGTPGDLVLQMDIEGAEFKVLRSCSLETLRHFRWAVVEFHGLDRMASSLTLRTRILPALRRMDQVFHPVHVHPNNCCGVVDIRGLIVPKVLEVTYLRRDRFVAGAPMGAFPHPLDRSCVKGEPPIELPHGWPLNSREERESDGD